MTTSSTSPTPVLGEARRAELKAIVEEVRAARNAKPFDPQRRFAACREYDLVFDADLDGFDVILALCAALDERDTAMLHLDAVPDVEPLKSLTGRVAHLIGTRFGLQVRLKKAEEEAERLRAALEAGEADTLFGCCTNCGRALSIKANPVNSLVNYYVTPNCDCHAPVNVWQQSSIISPPLTETTDG